MALRLIKVTAIVLLLVAAVQGEQRTDLVKAQLVADTTAIRPGEQFTVGVLLNIAPQWHVYWLNPGDSGIATSIRFNVPAGYEVGELRWPVPKRFIASGIVGYGYEEQVLLSATVQAPADARPGQSVQITAQADWLCCREECVQGGAKLSLTLPVRDRTEPAHAELFDRWRRRLPVDAEEPGSPVTVTQSRPGNIALDWRAHVKNVEFYPATSSALELTEISVEHSGRQSQVRYQAQVYDQSKVRDGRARGLVVYEEPDGQRRGVWVAVQVKE